MGWLDVVDAIRQAHLRPRPAIKDQFLQHDANVFVKRAAWGAGGGIGEKSFTRFPQNMQQDRSSVQGAMLVFDECGSAAKP